MNDLEQLKSLLFGAEKQTLDSIAARVERPESRTVDVADILPEAIHNSYRKNDELVASLKAPVGDCVRESFRDEPELYGDALYPVMGPAIRKSIMHALRTFAQDINTTMEQSLSPKGLKWRFQAWRSGVPFGEYVLQQSLLYRVEQAYLISRDNGLLIGHVHHDAARIKDSDAVSAMFTAIQDFVKESFSPDRTGRLETADMGEFTLWAVHGPHAMLVCVIRGLPPKSLRSDLSAILERIHFRYGEAIRNYAGDTATVKDVEQELSACLDFEARQAREAGKKGISMPLLIVLLLLAALLIAWGVQSWKRADEQQRLADALANTPGVYVGELQRDGATLRLRGMRDPLAASVEDIAVSAGVERDRIADDLRPYQSLDADIVLRRARAILAPPDGVELSLSGTTLTANGPASLAWQQQAIARLPAMPGVDEVTFTMSVDDQLALLKQYLEAPPTTEFSASGDVILVAGTASQQWIDGARAKLAAMQYPLAVSLAGLQSSDWQNLEAAVNDMDGAVFFFSSGANLFAESAENLQFFAGRLAAEFLAARNIGASITVELTGRTDGSGSDEVNARLAAARTAVVRAALTEKGIPATAITERRDRPASDAIDLRSRRVEVRLGVSAASDAPGE